MSISHKCPGCHPVAVEATETSVAAAEELCAGPQGPPPTPMGPTLLCLPLFFGVSHPPPGLRAGNSSNAFVRGQPAAAAAIAELSCFHPRFLAI
jgi:hypothetical protein